VRTLAVALALIVAAAGPAAAQTTVTAGRAIVARDCGGCHAIARRGASPVRKAPPLRTLSLRYDIDDLGEALAEGLSTGHPLMPAFSYEPDQIEEVLAYLKSIQRPVRSREAKP